MIEQMLAVDGYMEERGRSYEEFAGDAMLRDACGMRVNVLNELAREASKADPELFERHLRAALSGLNGMRNEIVHGYERFDWAVAWEYITVEFRYIRMACEAALLELRDRGFLRRVSEAAVPCQV